MFGKELFICFIVCVFCGRLSIFVRMSPSLPFGFGGGIWDLIVLISDHCLSFYFGTNVNHLQKMCGEKKSATPHTFFH